MALLALVLLGVQVERLRLVDDRALDGLAGRAVDAAHDDVDAHSLDELGGPGLGDLVVGRAVLDEQLDRPAEEPARGVDVVDHHAGDVGVGDPHEGERTGLVGDQPDAGRSVTGVRHRPVLLRVEGAEEGGGLGLAAGGRLP